jgi:tetratricopeptide (TPR) repeat protein
VASLFRNFFQSKTPASAAAPQIEELYAEATRAYQAKDFGRAVPLYERVIALQPDHAEAHYKRGNALKDLGQLQPALASYDAAVEHRPDFPHAWCNRGVVQQSLGSYEAALASFDRAIELAPTDAVAHSNRGALLQALSRWEEALASYDRVLELDPQSVQIWFHRGGVLRELRQIEAALASFREALQLKPDFAECHYNCGVLLERIQQPHAALASYDQAVEFNPGFHQAHYNRAGVLKAMKQPQAALAGYDRALAAKGDYAEAHANRGVVLQGLGRWDEALASYDQAIAVRSDYAECHFNRGTLLAIRMRWEEALASYDRALALDPRSAQAHCERAGVFMQTGRLEAALASYDQAVAIAPDFTEAQYNRSLALLMNGDYEQGWLAHEWRWANAEKLFMGNRSFTEPLWLGREPIAGKRLLLYSEQGLGDAVQFCRFAKSVADLGATVILEVQPALANLVQGLDGVARVIVESDPPPELDYRCPLLSVPLALKTTFDTIPGAGGYLRSDPAKVAGWRARLGNRSRPRVGLTWSGNPKHTNDVNRTVQLASLVDHLPRELDYVCLQKEFRPVDDEILTANPWIARFDTELHDFSDTAALCECIDLVISVDTSVAHVGGALGRPTWVLLPFNADWRWLVGRDDSPWYRSVKLYRQHAIGDWNGVFTRVAADLRGWKER